LHPRHGPAVEAFKIEVPVALWNEAIDYLLARLAHLKVIAEEQQAGRACAVGDVGKNFVQVTLHEGQTRLTGKAPRVATRRLDFICFRHPLQTRKE